MIILIAAIFILAIILTFAYLFLLPPKIQSISPASGATGVPLDSTIVIHFNKPVDRSDLIATITPEIQGEWKYTDQFYAKHLFRTLNFIPNQIFQPETTYQVKLDNMVSAISFKRPEVFIYNFTTQSLPGVKSVEPANGEIGLSPKTEVRVNLTEPNPELAEFEFLFEPEIKFTQSLNNAKNQYILEPDQSFKQGTKYQLKINRIFVVKDKTTQKEIFRGEPELLYDGNFAITPPAKIDMVSPTGDHAKVSDKISITFADAMNEESLKKNLTITPEIKGSANLLADKKTLTFTPAQKLKYETDYEVKIAAGTENEAGGFLEQEEKFSFKTIGYVYVAHFSPSDKSTGVAIGSSVKITFDQAVDHASAESRFSINPKVDGDFSWAGLTLNFKPKNQLSYSTNYQVTMAGGVKSIDGLDSAQDFSFGFTTEEQVVKLDVKIDFQDRALSCEAAALKMALAGKGVKVSEDDIMKYVGFDPTPHKGKTWGDPYQAYVGDINGKQNTTGYGVYWDPIARAANHWRSAEAFTGWSITQLAQEINKGNAVVAWGAHATGYQDSWQTPSGKSIYAWKGEHARTIIGFVGSVDNPSKIILNDPFVGQIYWTRQRFERDWKIFGNAGVVVR